VTELTVPATASGLQFGAADAAGAAMSAVAAAPSNAPADVRRMIVMVFFMMCCVLRESDFRAHDPRRAGCLPRPENHGTRAPLAAVVGADAELTVKRRRYTDCR
jgi:hypothetical protein